MAVDPIILVDADVESQIPRLVNDQVGERVLEAVLVALGGEEVWEHAPSGLALRRNASSSAAFDMDERESNQSVSLINARADRGDLPTSKSLPARGTATMYRRRSRARSHPHTPLASATGGLER